MQRIPPSKDEIIARIQAVAAEIGRTPTQTIFWLHTGLNHHHVLSHFVTWNEAIQAAGLVPFSGNVAAPDEVLLADWGAVARKAGRAPTLALYRRHGNHCDAVLARRFGAWSSVPARFRQFAAGRPEWADVLAMLSKSSLINSPYRRRRYIPVRSQPIDFGPLAREPANEQGVIFLFGMMAEKLGFRIETMQGAFPDCRAMRRGPDGEWRPLRIEFEYESRNFRDHGHPPDGCDMIICWKHNWPECPPNLEVLELSGAIKTPPDVLGT